MCGARGGREDRRLSPSSSAGWLNMERAAAFGPREEADDAVRRRQDCVRLVGTLEKAQRVLDELRAMPIEGALLDLQMNS